MDILWHSYKMEYYLAIKREKTIDSPNSHMNESQTYYTKWNDPVLKGYILYGPIYSRKDQNTGTENTLVVARG